jgi:predicted DNA-binding transcriptional regulator YafY
MATNKHALIRYKSLDKCFGNKWKKFFIEDLIEFCSAELSDYIGSETKVSRRQILDDITFMRSEGGYQAPIISMKEGRRVYYRYDPLDFSILKQPLNEAEQEQVRLALETLGRVKGMPQLEWLNTVQTKLSAGLGLDSSSVPVISFEENEFLKGLEYLEPLYQFINHKRVLQISYQGYRQENAEIHTIHPYYLKQYNNRWFLFGWNNGLARLQNMALDRILDISEVNVVSYRDCTIDFEAYFEDIIGVTNPEDRDVERIVLRFTTSRLPYVISKPLHGSQCLKDDLIHLELKVNRELISLLLSYGPDVEVFEPIRLRESISLEIKKMQANY